MNAPQGNQMNSPEPARKHAATDEQLLSELVGEVLSEYGETFDRDAGADRLQHLPAERFLQRAILFLKGRDDREHLLEQLRAAVLRPPGQPAPQPAPSSGTALIPE